MIMKLAIVASFAFAVHADLTTKRIKPQSLVRSRQPETFEFGRIVGLGDENAAFLEIKLAQMRHLGGEASFSFEFDISESEATPNQDTPVEMMPQVKSQLLVNNLNDVGLVDVQSHQSAVNSESTNLAMPSNSALASNVFIAFSITLSVVALALIALVGWKKHAKANEVQSDTSDRYASSFETELT